MHNRYHNHKKIAPVYKANDSVDRLNEQTNDVLQSVLIDCYTEIKSIHRHANYHSVFI